MFVSLRIGIKSYATECFAHYLNLIPLVFHGCGKKNVGLTLRIWGLQSKLIMHATHIHNMLQSRTVCAIMSLHYVQEDIVPHHAISQHKDATSHRDCVISWHCITQNER